MLIKETSAVAPNNMFCFILITTRLHTSENTNLNKNIISVKARAENVVDKYKDKKIDCFVALDSVYILTSPIIYGWEQGFFPWECKICVYWKPQA